METNLFENYTFRGPLKNKNIEKNVPGTRTDTGTVLNSGTDSYLFGQMPCIPVLNSGTTAIISVISSLI